MAGRPGGAIGELLIIKYYTALPLCVPTWAHNLLITHGLVRVHSGGRSVYFMLRPLLLTVIELAVYNAVGRSIAQYQMWRAGEGRRRMGEQGVQSVGDMQLIFSSFSYSCK